MEELAKQLSEDLNALNKFLVSDKPLPPSHVRITASPILRKWFIEGWINKLAKQAQVEYTFKSLDTDQIVSSIESIPDIQFFLTGGIMMDGLPIRGYYVSDVPPPSDGTQLIPIDKMKYRLLKPSHLLKSKRIYFKGHWFNFEDIIKFCANKYGGVHFDLNRSKKWEKDIEVASQYFIAGNPNGLTKRQIIEPYTKKNQILLVLPKEKGNIWNCLDIELLAAAQALLNIHVNGNPVATKQNPMAS
jgi:hypothetical protein